MENQYNGQQKKKDKQITTQETKYTGRVVISLFYVNFPLNILLTLLL